MFTRMIRAIDDFTHGGLSQGDPRMIELSGNWHVPSRPNWCATDFRDWFPDQPTLYRPGLQPAPLGWSDWYEWAEELT